MATTTTTFTPAYNRQAYIGFGFQGSLETPIPQAELNFIIYGETVTEAAAGLDQAIIVNCDLPAGYAYISRGVNVLLEDQEVGDIADWDTDWRAFAVNSLVASPSRWLSGIPLEGGLSWFHSATLSGRTFKADAFPKLINCNDGPGLLRGGLINPTIDGGPMALYWVASFLEFDLNQARHWAVNTPIPVR